MAYPHSVIASLQQKIQNLERQLEEANGASNQQEAPGAGSGAGGESRTPEQQAWADSIRNEAEEVGVLAVGGNQRRSEGQYSK